MRWFLFVAVMSSAGGTSSQIVPVDTFEQYKMLDERSKAILRPKIEQLTSTLII